MEDTITIVSKPATIKITADLIIVLSHMDTLFDVIFVQQDRTIKAWSVEKPFMAKACTVTSENSKMTVTIVTWNITEIKIPQLICQVSKNLDLKEKFLSF